MRLLLVPGLPLAAICLGIDTRIASAPPPVIAALDRFPFVLLTLIALLLLFAFARRRL